MNENHETLSDIFSRWFGVGPKIVGDPEYEELTGDIEAMLAGPEPNKHPMFEAVFGQVLASMRGSPLTLLLGLSGVGKSRLLEALVQRFVDNVGTADQVPAVYLVAPTAQRQNFSWKAFWERLMHRLHDPLPGQKIHPAGRAEAIRAGVPARTTEAQFFEMVCSAARSRGLKLLVIDEAIALSRSEAGVTLTDQLHVLRELADLRLFRVVLGSTFQMVEHLRRAAVLDRRLHTVVFPRYQPLPAGDGPVIPTDEYLAFARAARTFMDRLPVGGRLHLTPEHYFHLYRASLGCVGLLCDLYVRAIAGCVVLGEERLRWCDMADAVLDVTIRANMVAEAREAEAQMALLSDLRLDLDEDQLFKLSQSVQPKPSPSGARGAPTVAAPVAGKKRGRRRPGKPHPKAMDLPDRPVLPDPPDLPDLPDLP